MVLIAHPDVDEVWEQQRLDIPGLYGSAAHYFDFVVRWKSGRQSACAVKYDEDVDDDLRALLKRAAIRVGDVFANDFRLLKEDGINRTMIWNASRIISCAKDDDDEAQRALSKALVKASDYIRVGDCDEFLGDGERGSRAAIAMIKTGRLVIENGQRLCRDTVLRNLFTN